MGAPRLYTPEEAAERLACKESWLKRQASRREVPHVIVAGQIRFRDEDLAAIVAAGERLPEQPAEVIPARRTPTTAPQALPPGVARIEPRGHARRIKPKPRSA